MDDGRALRDALQKLFVAHGALSVTQRPCGAKLTLPHAYALMALLHHGGPMSVKTLASKLHIDRTNVSRLAARMESAGELQRTDDPSDGRSRRLSLTPKGTALARAVDTSSADHFGRLADLMADLPQTVRALDELRATMTTIQPAEAEETS